MSKIQSLLLDRRFFKNRKQAIRWIKDHGFKILKIDTTQSYYRFRQFEPNKKYKYRTIPINNKVMAVIKI